MESRFALSTLSFGLLPIVTEIWVCAKTARARTSMLPACGLGNREIDADLPQHEIGLAVAHVQRNAAIGVVGDIALLEIARFRAVVIASAEVERERRANGNQEAASENSRSGPVTMIGIALILDRVVFGRHARLRVKAHQGIGRTRVRAERAVWKPELQAKRAESDAIVRGEVERNASVIADEASFVAVLDATAIGAKRKPSLRLDLHQGAHIEAVTGRDASGGKLALGLRDREIAPN